MQLSTFTLATPGWTALQPKKTASFALLSTAMQLFTLGYEGLSLSQFFQILKENEVQTLLDVRQKPLSRKPGFSKTALMASCALHGLRYVHAQELGCPVPIRNAYREDGDWKQYTRDYTLYLEGQNQSIEALKERAKSESCCLMCFEADVNFCHRSFVAEAVEQGDDIEVVHLTQTSIRSANPALLLAGR